VELKLNARAQRENDPVFHIELVYAGLFQIVGVPEAEMEPVLMIECPRFLFPVRAADHRGPDRRGGFPPFLLEPIDFASVYASRRAAAAQGQPAGLA